MQADRPVLSAAPWKRVAKRRDHLVLWPLKMQGQLVEPPLVRVELQKLRGELLMRRYPKLMPMRQRAGLRDHDTLRVKPLKWLPRVC